MFIMFVDPTMFTFLWLFIINSIHVYTCSMKTKSPARFGKWGINRPTFVSKHFQLRYSKHTYIQSNDGEVNCGFILFHLIVSFTTYNKITNTRHLICNNLDNTLIKIQRVTTYSVGDNCTCETASWWYLDTMENNVVVYLASMLMNEVWLTDHCYS